MESFKSLGSALACALLPACIAPPAAETPAAEARAAQAEAERPPAEQAGSGASAVLEGPVAAIDGRPAAHGVAHEIAPGCHVVKTSSEFLEVTETVTVRGSIQPVEIVIDARPGHRYVVERKVLAPTAPSARVAISARELDAAGRETRRFLAMQDPAAALDRCRRRAG